MTLNAASPSAAGPAGEQFEAKVGASYLLALLLEAEPRGCPGSQAERIQLQGASLGFPLDDVIAHVREADGSTSVLEIQVKRSIKFSPGDTVFHDVLLQVAEAVRAGKLLHTHRYGMGIATAQISRKIAGPYQDLLHWARKTQSSALFFAKLHMPKVANDDMRAFVSTVQTKLSEYGAAADDETVWKVLRALQILVYDFSEQGQSEALTRDRCRLALAPDHQSQAGALWSCLVDIAQDIAVAGGDIDRATLRETIVRKSGLVLAVSANNGAALQALAESSRHALANIRDSIAGARLSRHMRTDLVNASFDRGRYVEILGDAGVGKSGVLRTFAEQYAASSRVIVLTPARTTPRGWTALRHEIGYTGSAADLLNELATSGAGVLFADGVDMFSEEQRATVNDLVREAACTPGFTVVVTARRSFGRDEPNWLPADALATLGRAPAVVIDELSQDEVEELRAAAPELQPLLSDGHPAQKAVRNLFRLEWLFQHGQQDDAPRTETEMALRWWRSADGRPDDTLRDRARVLRSVGEASLSGVVSPLPADGYLSAPLDALIRSGSLTEPYAEKVTFRHDVFRDWAVANILHEDEANYGQLPLSRPAPASLFRGVELAARLALESQDDSDRWHGILQRLSGVSVHGSWKRAATLALVRSENSDRALDLAEAELVADSGALLGDLVRTIMAVDTMPISQLLATASATLPAGIADFEIPSGPGWRRLISWTLKLNNRLPASTIPDIIKFYITFGTNIFIDRLVDSIVVALHAWLTMMEGAPSPFGEAGPPAPRVGSADRHTLQLFLRAGFFAMSQRRPDLAEQYLRYVLGNDNAIRRSAGDIIMAPGNLAKSAPDALAELTVKALVPTEQPQRARYSGTVERPEPFTMLDKKFLSPSPTRGPFLSLLMDAPITGLNLVRRIVLHACTFDQVGPPMDDDAISVLLPGGPRSFRYLFSYFWSRDSEQGYCLTSALMALEAWAHIRVERGDDVEACISDVLGDEDGAPAAFLLVIVDIILSHWSKAWKVGIPFVASPELLAWDRSRHSRDQMGLGFDGFGDPEPFGPATRKSLRERASRGAMLERTLPIYTFHAPDDDLALLRDKLQQAKARLPAYEAHSDFGDPRFMVGYALNVTDPANYQAREIVDESGEPQTAYEYVSPSEEAAHLRALGQRRGPSMADAELRAAISLTLGDTSRSSSELIERALAWAKSVDESGEEQPSYDNSVLITAYLLLRDGNESQLSANTAWARAQFEKAIASAEDTVHRMRNGLLHNPMGIATAGLVLYARYTQRMEDCRVLLEIAAKGDPAAAHGFSEARLTLDELEPRLANAILRCAFSASIRPYLKRYGDDLSEDDARSRQVAQWRQAALSAEWVWISENGPEPDWPTFPEPNIGVRDHLVLGGGPRKARRTPHHEAYYADHQGAAVWLRKFMRDDFRAPEWLKRIATWYRDWTARLNGTGLDVDDELSREPHEWNDAYYALVARSLTGLDAAQLDQLAIAPVIELPNRAFLDAMDSLQIALDAVYFRDAGLDSAVALPLRMALIERLKKTSQWRRFAASPGHGISLELSGPLGAAMLCQSGFREPPHCYVTSLGIERAAAFIPTLTALAISTPSLFVAKAVLSIGGVSTEFPFIPFVVASIDSCMTAFPDDTTLWHNYGVGDTFCDWLEGVLSRFGSEALDQASVRPAIERLLSELIRLGVSSATSLEARIA